MGKAEAALTDFEAAARFFKARGDSGPGIAAWRRGAARPLQALGRNEEAARLARDDLERARAFGAPGVISAALQTAALTGPREEALGLLTEAVSILDDSPLRLERARALVELGAALRRSGERAGARARLEEGLEIARSCGAIPLAERAYQELRAAGVRPRKVLRAGVDSLTPSEMRVAELAASGKTNRDIAQQLYVTPKTVEFHLGQTYRKLDISSRKGASFGPRARSLTASTVTCSLGPVSAGCLISMSSRRRGPTVEWRPSLAILDEVIAAFER